MASSPTLFANSCVHSSSQKVEDVKEVDSEKPTDEAVEKGGETADDVVYSDDEEENFPEWDGYAISLRRAVHATTLADQRSCPVETRGAL